ncbi:DDE superfamily endonuclease, CENP-B-like protein [Metarhizium robertsii ARSEF 23]|uniref:DDE superfamily endonuclease, CENP-B-like protein n=1 Tax=Metarhizium robertsii (strain ARSEF 23 / ATCC MYA-3075) TaxID=655844 RepID=E9ENC4_METRA|nr:DDE superfamily endonuclease, CENP-B-like protein [Metarhizium robertsii ARSEF 23]EFZ04136.2 DDE superfamily endonuclease, CENP-B-like protein [Metarhizium robertsii ARSEF 23]
MPSKQPSIRDFSRNAVKTWLHEPSSHYAIPLGLIFVAPQHHKETPFPYKMRPLRIEGGTILKFRISASEMRNKDKARMRIGYLRERVQALVTCTSRLKAARPEVLDPANRESCTVIASINIIGDSLPPWLVFAHYPTTNWAGIDIGTRVRFAPSPTGFSNAEIHLEWARHFNCWSWASSAQAKQSGKDFEQWFRCGEHLRLPGRGMSSVEIEKPPVDRPDEKILYRLLVLEGFTGHTTLALTEYCIKFNIIIAILPPHATHLMQPLDVGVSQPLKAAHQKALRKSLAEGNLTFSRIDFVAEFQQVYEAGFPSHNIMSGFEETGLWPASPQPVLAKLLQEQLRQRKRMNPAYTSLRACPRCSDVGSLRHPFVVAQPTRTPRICYLIFATCLLKRTRQAAPNECEPSP